MNKQMCFFDKNVLVDPDFYKYSVLELPNHSSITTSLTHNGSHRTVVPFDPPMQNTIIINKTHIFTYSYSNFIYAVAINAMLQYM